MLYKSSSPRINREHFFWKIIFLLFRVKDNRGSFLRFFTVASFSRLCILLSTTNTIWKHDNPLIIKNDNYNWYQTSSCIILEWVRSQRQRFATKYNIQDIINNNSPFEIHSFHGINSIRISWNFIFWKFFSI